MQEKLKETISYVCPYKIGAMLLSNIRTTDKIEVTFEQCMSYLMPQMCYLINNHKNFMAMTVHLSRISMASCLMILIGLAQGSERTLIPESLSWPQQRNKRFD